MKKKLKKIVKKSKHINKKIMIFTIIIVMLYQLTFSSIPKLLPKLYNQPEKEEETTKGNTLEFKITREMADYFNEKYNSLKEFGACLKISSSWEIKGEYIDSIYLIDDIDGKLKYYSKGYSEHNDCEKALIHSHPENTCMFSVGDIESFKYRIKRGEYLFVIMCGKDKFMFITRNYFKERELTIEEYAESGIQWSKK